MARIILFRHGKAEQPTANVADFDRRLSSRGRRNADQMGAFLATQNMLPDQILVSPAARTIETLKIACQAWPKIEQIVCDSIYEATASGLLLLVAEKSRDARNVMIIGHNPSLVVALNHMVEERHSDRNLSYFPTCCVANVGFAVDKLGAITPHEGTLLSMIRVRDLAA